MKPWIHVSIAAIALIAVLATAGCLGPASSDPAINATPEPTPEPCETCTVPEGFCGPPEVCPGEPVNGIYVFTDKNVYRIGEVVEFGIVNCGDETVVFGSPSPWHIEKWVTNAPGGTPGNDASGTWEIIDESNYVQTMKWSFHPGMNETGRWNTTDDNVTLAPGKYRIRCGDRNTFIKEFEFV